MDVVQWSFTHDQDQFAAFFEDHVGSAVNQVVSVSVSNGGKRPHTARAYDHPLREERTARDGRSFVLGCIMARGHLLDLFEAVGCLMKKRARAPFAEHQMRLDPRTLQ